MDTESYGGRIRVLALVLIVWGYVCVFCLLVYIFYIRRNALILNFNSFYRRKVKLVGTFQWTKSIIHRHLENNHEKKKLKIKVKL